MPKRKRPHAVGENWNNIDRTARKQKVAYVLSQAEKRLHRVLKTAKCFERQRLSKRIARAETAAEKDRINTEIKVLKSLNIDEAVNSHLHKSLGKVKVFAESGLLPEKTVNQERDNLASGNTRNPSEEIAYNNVISGIMNLKIVKESIEQIHQKIYLVIGIRPVPSHNDQNERKKLKSQPVKEQNGCLSLKANDTSQKMINQQIKDDGLFLEESDSGNKNMPESPEWESFEMNDDDEQVVEGKITHGRDSSHVSNKEHINENNEELDNEDNLISYDGNILSDSSDQEEFDEKRYMLQQSIPSIKTHSSLNTSCENDFTSMPNPQISSSVSDITAVASNSPKKNSHKTLNRSASSIPITKANFSSTFLPTLMGGYWSGSEGSVASDLEELTPAIRKNRPGQMARRALAEKKYGKMANHLKPGRSGLARNRENVNSNRDRDRGWDPTRGAVNDNYANSISSHKGNSHFPSRRGRVSAQVFNNSNRMSSDTDGISKINGSRPGAGGSNGTFKGINQTKSNTKKRDDLGVLHPSWQAAKKAKELKQTAQFQGKKIVFLSSKKTQLDFPSFFPSKEPIIIPFK